MPKTDKAVQTETPFVPEGMAAARIQVLEQQLASGLFGGRPLRNIEKELAALKNMHPGI